MKVRPFTPPTVAQTVTNKFLSETMHALCDFGEVSANQIVEITDSNLPTAELIMQRLIADRVASRQGYGNLKKNEYSQYNFYDKTSSDDKALKVSLCGLALSAFGLFK